MHSKRTRRWKQSTMQRDLCYLGAVPTKRTKTNNLPEGYRDTIPVGSAGNRVLSHLYALSSRQASTTSNMDVENTTEQATWPTDDTITVISAFYLRKKKLHKTHHPMKDAPTQYTLGCGRKSLSVEYTQSSTVAVIEYESAMSNIKQLVDSCWERLGQMVLRKFVNFSPRKHRFEMLQTLLTLSASDDIRLLWNRGF